MFNGRIPSSTPKLRDMTGPAFSTVHSRPPSSNGTIVRWGENGEAMLPSVTKGRRLCESRSDNTFLQKQTLSDPPRVRPITLQGKEVLSARAVDQPSAVSYSFACRYAVVPTLFGENTVNFPLCYLDILGEDLVSFDV